MKRKLIMDAFVVTTILFTSPLYSTLPRFDEPLSFFMSSDLWLLKTNTDGDTLWTRTYGGDFEDKGYSLQQTPDGGYIIVGMKDGNMSSEQGDLWLLKTDSLGDTLWTRTYGEEFQDEGECIQLDSDGGYIIVGVKGQSLSHSKGDIWLLKTDSLGDTLWTKTYGGELVDNGNYVQLTSDGGYIITGTRDFSTKGKVQKLWLLKIGSQGDTQWTRTYGKRKTRGNSVQQTVDNGYIITGTKSGRFWLLKTDIDGEIIWESSYKYGYGESVIESSAEYYVSTGHVRGEVCLLKTDCSGKTIWLNTYCKEDIIIGRNVSRTLDGGYIMIGVDNLLHWLLDTNLWVAKCDSNGELCWVRSYGGNKKDEGYSIQQINDGGYILLGFKDEEFVMQKSPE